MTATAGAPRAGRGFKPADVPFWAIALGLAAMAIPTFITLGSGSWSREDGAHAPLVVATGGWLLWREKDNFKAAARPGNFAVGLGLLLMSLAA